MRNLNLPSHRSKVAILSSVHEALDPRIFHRQARTLVAAGFDVHLLARHARNEVRDGVRIYALPELRSRWGRPAQWLRLAWRTSRLRPRLIHVHDPELLPLLLLLRLLTGAAAIYDAHEYYAEEVARRTWILRPLRRPAARLTHLVEMWIARRIDAVVAVNEHMAAGFRARGARSIAVHNFPEAEFFASDAAGESGTADALPGVGSEAIAAPASSVRDAGTAAVAYIGMLSPDRGLATVYRGAQLLRAWLPHALVRVVGRVDWSGLPADLPRDAAAWKAAGVDLVGTVPATDVPASLRSIAIGWIPFLDTGNNRRTIPLKLLEYMAAGKPVVASNIGYIAEIVQSSGCGMLAPPGDAEAHARALAHLLAHPDQMQRMGAAGRTVVRARYTWAREGEKLVALYREVMREALRVRCVMRDA